MLNIPCIITYFPASHHVPNWSVQNSYLRAVACSPCFSVPTDVFHPSSGVSPLHGSDSTAASTQAGSPPGFAPTPMGCLPGSRSLPAQVIYRRAVIFRVAGARESTHLRCDHPPPRTISTAVMTIVRVSFLRCWSDL